MADNVDHPMRGRGEIMNRRSFLAALFAGLFTFALTHPALAEMRKVKLKIPGCG